MQERLRNAEVEICALQRELENRSAETQEARRRERAWQAKCAEYSLVLERQKEDMKDMASNATRQHRVLLCCLWVIIVLSCACCTELRGDASLGVGSANSPQSTAWCWRAKRGHKGHGKRHHTSTLSTAQPALGFFVTACHCGCKGELIGDARLGVGSGNGKARRVQLGAGKANMRDMASNSTREHRVQLSPLGCAKGYSRKGVHMIPPSQFSRWRDVRDETLNDP